MFALFALLVLQNEVLCLFLCCAFIIYLNLFCFQFFLFACFLPLAFHSVMIRPDESLGQSSSPFGPLSLEKTVGLFIWPVVKRSCLVSFMIHSLNGRERKIHLILIPFIDVGFSSFLDESLYVFHYILLFCCLLLSFSVFRIRSSVSSSSLSPCY